MNKHQSCIYYLFKECFTEEVIRKFCCTQLIAFRKFLKGLLDIVEEELESMNDKVKFYEMTKPPKFRKIRLFAKSLGRTYEVGTERIKYLTNYFLYKLNILERYTYKDSVHNTERPLHAFPEREVQGDYIGAILDMHLVTVTEVDADYFFRVCKDGSHKITYVVKEHNKEYKYLEFNLKNIHFKVGENWYCVDHLPTFRCVHPNELKPTVFSDNADEVIGKETYTTVNYNIGKIRRLTHEYYLGTDLKDNYITEEMLQYYYYKACDEFEHILSNIKLSDLM